MSAVAYKHWTTVRGVPNVWVEIKPQQQPQSSQSNKKYIFFKVVNETKKRILF